MPTDIPKQYDPQAAEAKWFPFWERNGYFNADPDPRRPPHVIMMPLPNVTGALHMGHALNGTLQDLVTRLRRMQGYVALWMPGTDHAGIATQAVVERRMFEQEGLTRHDVGREALVQRIWKWKDEYEQRIRNQQKLLGASCDWRRARFTLDDVCSKAVRRTFFRMFQDGLIYRGKRLVNWDTFLQTAVADDEVYTEEVAGKFWTFRYPVVTDAGQPTGEFIAFSTTRPETMLGDTAVCVHPSDERYTHLIGKQVQIPLNGRRIPIIADGLLADKELGTGCVKVTPAHDPNDYAAGLRNGLPMINLMNPDGTFNENAGPYQGQDRYAVRDAVVAEMERLGHFLNVEDRPIPLKYSDRSKTPIEPYLSDQWFVKMDTLATKAVDAVKNGDVEFFPARYASTYLDWLEEKRDWCISRQLWWGHRIPVWRLPIGQDPNMTDELEAQINRIFGLESFFMAAFNDALEARGWGGSNDHVAFQLSYNDHTGDWSALVCIGPDQPQIEEAFRREFGDVQDPDVLDTWFSSALWPHATLGWPDRDHNPPIEIADPQNLRPEGLRGSTRYMIPPSICLEMLWLPLGESHGKLVVAVGATNADATIRRIEHTISRQILPVIFSDDDVRRAIENSFTPEELAYDWSSGQLGTPEPPPPQPSGNAVLSYFYPGSVLITTRDIITLWVARMVLTGLYNLGDVPFRHVHVHPKILDGFGQTMSKSKGNGVDPLDLIARYGADGLRFTIASLAGETQDVRLPISYACPHCDGLISQTLDHQKAKPKDGRKPRVKCPKCKKDAQYTSPNYDPDPGEPVATMVSERFEYGRNFCNKLWNACRFAMLNLEGFSSGSVAEADLTLEDRWILSRLATVTDDVTRALDKYQFDQATRSLREFVWNEFCDWYLEMIKPRLRADAGAEEENPGMVIPGLQKASCQRVLVSVVDAILRLLQPFTPFITEELWQRLAEIAPERPMVGVESRESRVESQREASLSEPPALSPQPLALNPYHAAAACIVAPWPSGLEAWKQPALEARFQRLQDTIIAVRNLRGLYNISPAATVSVSLRCAADVAGDVRQVAAQFELLAKAKLQEVGPEIARPKMSASFSLADADGYMPLEGLIDREAEVDRQRKEAEKLRGFIAGHEKKLENRSFVDRAPPEVVAEVRETLASLKKQLASAEDVVRQLTEA
jgi:valyl-tRNA synthetase